MTSSRRATVVGVFRERSQAQEAVRALKQAGFRDDQVGVISRGEDSAPAAERDTGTMAAEGAGVGAAAGAGVGALWALGIAAGVLPAVGPVIAGGLLMSVLASAGGAATVGTVVGALVGLGVLEDEAAYYEGEFKAGGTLVTVQAEDRYAEAWALLQGYGAYGRDTDATYHRADTATAAAAVPVAPTDPGRA